MAYRHLTNNSASCRLQPLTTHLKRSKALLSISLLCILALLLVSCSLGQGTSHNPATGRQAGNAQLTYVAIGASDTFGFGTDDPYNENWAADLAAKLGTSYHFINLGIPSVSIHQALSIELPIALDAHPDLVTIWLAVNDIIDNVSLPSYSQDLETFISRLQAEKPDVRIAIANVPDLTLLPYFMQQSTFDPQKLHTEIQAYNTVIASAVSRHHAILIDLSLQKYDLQSHPEYISQDGLHPTLIGYTRLADLFYEAIQKAQNSAG